MNIRLGIFNCARPKDRSVDQAVSEPSPSLAINPKASPSQGGSVVIVAYAITIFASAFLLFQVQPLISKFILPWFGGSPAVWTAAMLFFQIVLFGGYLYAHLTSTYLKARGQFVLHLALLAFAAALALYTQISPHESLKPTGDEKSPLLQILMLLGVTVGVPYFALSSTGPLLQKWFSDAFDGVSPYRLFALSNVGSLLALLSYPFFFEVYWDSRQQAFMWSLGFALFAVCCGFCAWWTYRARQSHAAATVHSASRNATAVTEPAPTWWLRGAWIALPALASVMFLAITNEVCQNVATVPLLWIIPLSFYLVSFIVAFDHPRWYSRPLCAIPAILLLVYMANFDGFASGIADTLNSLFGLKDANEIVLDGWVAQCSVYFLALLLVCLICHCELAALKPGTKHLTSYFLSMSLGGALGGIFVNLVATNIFTTFFELTLALLVATALAGWVLSRWAAKHGQGAKLAVACATGLALLIIGYWQIIDTMNIDPSARNITLYRARSFFGIVSVQHRNRGDLKWENITFKSGHIAHGRQYVDPARHNSPEVGYYGRNTGCGIALDYKLKQPQPCRIGVVGLGAGTIAAYARPGDYVRMYEINPLVLDIARNHFDFLDDCAAAPVDVVLGDARLKLQQEWDASNGKGNEFDVLVLDAFSGDSIPTHLITTEAFELYKRHLKPDGIIVAHITNSYLDLYPVVRELAKEHGFGMTRIYRPSEDDTLVERTYYGLLTTDQKFLEQTPEDLVKIPPSFLKKRDIPIWTDRYHNLFQVLR